MASWIAALKLVPWGEVIKATPQVMKAAQSMLKKKDAQEEAREQAAHAQQASHLSPPASASEQALRLIQQQEERIAQLEQSQRQSLEIIEKLAEQNAQIVTTVGALRIGAQRLAWTCGALGISLVSLAVYVFRH
ncbi:hypothetical protein [Comamonas resistens]|uniref:DUF1640 domain-containing protein n=1 Tax=Comamonas resistens TaxID=3046670 RepID=A0ABY8SU89_9BURK|nr:hypothetical protein [Comamonas resistens]MDL5035325.1 hypothetical protein [Comamonas resistens]WHS66614.1 hypothetical protein QMY55_05600 [Comamonas resistens]